MKTDLIRPVALQEGDRVRLVSPASFPSQSHVDDYIRTLESWGLRCDTGKHVLSEHGYMAGIDAERLEDLNDAFRDPHVRAVITTTGGAGAYRLANRIDFDAVRADHKPIVGFSDITSLHLSMLKHCNLGGIHGCLVGHKAQASVKQLLMSTEPITLERDPSAVSAEIEFPGRARGVLIGGNLQMLATSVGAWMPSMEGAILFLEYHRAGLGTIDRYLTQLIQSGAIDGIVGVALGSFECCRDFTDRGWGIADVLNDHLQSLKVPVLGGLYAGHNLTDENGNHDQSAIPLGTFASLDVNAGTLTVESLVK
jgi:muramoyltetrapeptide carboxypeptidase